MDIENSIEMTAENNDLSSQLPKGQVLNSSLVAEMSNLRNVQVVDQPFSEDLIEGEVLLEVDRFSLTSNNVTYGAMGEAFGYWSFFPFDEKWGRIPVWGFANVIASKCKTIEVGERVYGFMPMSSFFKVCPGNIRNHAWTDQTKHRSQLPAVYNHYVRTEEDPLYKKSYECERVVFGPLFSTAFVLAHFLKDENWFGSEQIIVTSASSKTAIATAYILECFAPNNLDLIALTSKQNRNFVDKLPFYSSTFIYDQVFDVPAKPSVLLDFSGNRAVISAVHQYFSQELTKSIAIGATHWDKLEGVDSDLETAGLGLPGPKLTMFHAPTEIHNRHKEWGPLEYGKRQGAEWHKFTSDIGEWIVLSESKGLASAGRTLSSLIAGKAKADRAYTISLK